MIVEREIKEQLLSIPIFNCLQLVCLYARISRRFSARVIGVQAPSDLVGGGEEGGDLITRTNHIMLESASCTYALESQLEKKNVPNSHANETIIIPIFGTSKYGGPKGSITNQFTKT